MSAQILAERRTLAMRRMALAAIGISFLGLSATTFGADLRVADPGAVATAPAGHHATPAHPVDPPAINEQSSRAFVDGLYRELMDWTRLRAYRRRTTRHYAAAVKNFRFSAQPDGSCRRRNVFSPLEG